MRHKKLASEYLLTSNKPLTECVRTRHAGGFLCSLLFARKTVTPDIVCISPNLNKIFMPVRFNSGYFAFYQAEQRQKKRPMAKLSPPAIISCHRYFVAAYWPEK